MRSISTAPVARAASRAVAALLAVAALVPLTGCLVSPDASLWRKREAGADSQGRPDARRDVPATDSGADLPRADQAADAGQRPRRVLLAYGRSPSGLRSAEWTPATGWKPVTTVAGMSAVSAALALPARDAGGEDLVAVMWGGPAKSQLALYGRSGSSGWSQLWNTGGCLSGHPDKRSFALAREGASGDLLLVYATGAKVPSHRTRVGGTWSTATPLPALPGSGKVLWVELLERPGSDELTLLYADDNDDLVAVRWDGKAWDATGAAVLETALKTNPTSKVVNNRAFHGAYEAGSGDLLVAWGDGSTSGFKYSLRAAGGSSWTTASNIKIVQGYVEHVDLAADPASDAIAGVFLDLGNGTERLGLAMWDGTTWVDEGELDSQIRDVDDGAQGDFLASVAWLGTSGTAVAAYADNVKGTLDWASGTVSAGWSLATPAPITVKGRGKTPKGYTESVELAAVPGSGEVIAALADHNRALFLLRYDGLKWHQHGVDAFDSVSSSISMPLSLR